MDDPKKESSPPIEANQVHELAPVEDASRPLEDEYDQEQHDSDGDEY